MSTTTKEFFCDVFHQINSYYCHVFSTAADMPPTRGSVGHAWTFVRAGGIEIGTHLPPSADADSFPEWLVAISLERYAEKTLWHILLPSWIGGYFWRAVAQRLSSSAQPPSTAGGVGGITQGAVGQSQPSDSVAAQRATDMETPVKSLLAIVRGSECCSFGWRGGM